MRLLALGALLVFELVSPAYTFACDEAHEATVQSTCIADVMMHGNRGMWFELKTSEELRRKVNLLPHLESQVTELSRLSALWQQEALQHRKEIALMDAIQKNMQKQLNLAATDAQRAREALDAKSGFWRSPVFWGISMFLVGAIAQNLYFQSTK